MICGMISITRCSIYNAAIGQLSQPVIYRLKPSDASDFLWEWNEESFVMLAQDTLHRRSRFLKPEPCDRALEQATRRVGAKQVLKQSYYVDVCERNGG